MITAEHRPAFEGLLEGAKRALAVDEWAIEYLTDDKKEAEDEGYEHVADAVAKKIERHQTQKALREKEIAALTAALANTQKEDS